MDALLYDSTPNNARLKVQSEAERQGLIKRQRIGGADCHLFKARPVVGIYGEALCADPLDLFGIHPH